MLRTVLTLSSDYFHQQAFVVQDLRTRDVPTHVSNICYPKIRTSKGFKAYYEFCDRNASKEFRRDSSLL